MIPDHKFCFERLLNEANKCHFNQCYGLAGYFTELALRSVGRPATGLEMPSLTDADWYDPEWCAYVDKVFNRHLELFRASHNIPDTPLRPTPQQKRHALKQSFSPWSVG